LYAAEGVRRPGRERMLELDTATESRTLAEAERLRIATKD
jgi:hypothetical protein